jgi:transketolase
MKRYEQLLQSLATDDERIVVMTAENRAAIRSLPAQLGQRFIDVGICEQTLLGVAAGLAVRGRLPVVHALAAFLTMRGFEFIRTDIGIAHLPVILVGGVPGLLSDGNGPTHQAIEDIGLMRAIPGMAVIAPADEEELLAALSAAVKFGGPCYVRYYDGPPVTNHTGTYQLGEAETLGDASADVAIATYGHLVSEAVRAQALLDHVGVTACVLNMRTIAPLDEACVRRSAVSNQLLVVLEDHLQTGGLFSAIAEQLAVARLPSNLLPLNLKNNWFRPGTFEDVLHGTGLCAQLVAEAILNHWEKNDGKRVNRHAGLPVHRSLELDLG